MELPVFSISIQLDCLLLHLSYSTLCIRKSEESKLIYLASFGTLLIILRYVPLTEVKLVDARRPTEAQILVDVGHPVGF